MQVVVFYIPTCKALWQALWNVTGTARVGSSSLDLQSGLDGCKRQTNRVFIAVMTSSLTRGWWLLDQNIFPTLVLARQDGQAGIFSLIARWNLHDTNSVYLHNCIHFGRTPPIILKIGSKIVMSCTRIR